MQGMVVVFQFQDFLFFFVLSWTKYIFGFLTVSQTKQDVTSGLLKFWFIAFFTFYGPRIK